MPLALEYNLTGDFCHVLRLDKRHFITVFVEVSMKESLKRIVDSLHRYNTEHMAAQAFGLSEDVVYDALVIAPSFTPYKLHMEKTCKVTTLKEGAYIAGYLVEKDGLNIAWIKIGSSAGNLIDHMAICAELSFKRMIFVGAVGGLKETFKLGDVCTPSYSISGSYADSYLMKDSIQESMLFTEVVPDMKYVDKVIEIGKKKGYYLRKASVFCTPSIALEYTHLDEIKSFDTDLIEMETSSFYLMTDLFELPGIALLVVSDNSASGAALVGRTEEEQQQYDYGRNVVLPDMIVTLAAE
jgi:purine-nucleoside phosphorylase